MRSRSVVIGMFTSSAASEDSDRFRSTPASDRGNASYGDRGQLGSYQTDAEPFRDPSDVRHFDGYGATEADLKRGYCEPVIREDPAYDKANYQDRYSLPRQPDEDQGNPFAMTDDMEFRNRNRRANGFLPRPRIPNERN